MADVYYIMSESSFMGVRGKKERFCFDFHHVYDYSMFLAENIQNNKYSHDVKRYLSIRLFCVLLQFLYNCVNSKGGGEVMRNYVFLPFLLQVWIRMSCVFLRVFTLLMSIPLRLIRANRAI